MRRAGAFFLGVIFGIILIFGGLVVAVVVVTPKTIYGESDKFLGDLSNMSFYNIYSNISTLYKNKVGKIDENGQYYTLGKFLENYHIDTVAAFGKKLPEDVLDIPIFELISGNTDTTFKQVKVSALFELVNMFMDDEDKESKSTGAFFSAETIAKMRKYTIAELLDSQKGVTYVFNELRLSDLLSNVFPAERTDDNTVMWALGQTTIGGFLGSIGGNILLQLKPDGAFETLGGLQLSEIFSDASAMLITIFGNKKFVDLIDDNGNIYPETLLDGIYLGSLLDLQRNEIDINAYRELCSNKNCTVFVKEEGGQKKYAIQRNDVAYLAKLTCSNQGHTDDTHTVDCFGYNWYSATATNTPSDTDMVKDGKHYPLTTGIYGRLADITAKDLTGGDVDSLFDIFLDMKVSDLLNGQELVGMLGGLSDMTLRQIITEGFDNIYIGTLLGNVRHEVDGAAYTQDVTTGVKQDASGKLAKVENDVWYESRLNCDLQHTHTPYCYEFAWFESTDSSYLRPLGGAQGYLSNKKLSQLQSIDDLLKDLTLGDMMENLPDIFVSLKDVRIGELDKAIINMYLGDFLGYKQDANDSSIWYDCTTDHEHGSGCKQVTGMMGKLAGEKMGNLKNLSGKLYTFTLRDVLGDDVPSMLKSIADTPIGEIGDAIDNMYIGDLLGYSQGEMGDDGYIIWYDCNTEHQHGSGCKQVEGMIGKLAGEKFSDLSNISDVIQNFTLKDVLEDNIPDALKSLENTKIKDLNTAIKTAYLGPFLGYERKEVDSSGYQIVDGIANLMQKEGKYILKDGSTWYEATLACTDNSANHSHDATCYTFTWYNDEQAITGLISKMANMKMNDLTSSGIMDVIKDTKVGEIVEFDNDSNGLLKELANVKVSELSKELDALYVGVAMGYHRNEKQFNGSYDVKLEDLDNTNNKKSENVVYKKGNDVYFFDARRNTYYEAQLMCLESNHSTDSAHTFGCYGFVWYNNSCLHSDGVTHDANTIVKGLNGKMSNLQISELGSDGGMNKIARSLTIFDLIDGGIMDPLDNESMYKLDILFDNCGKNGCNISGYLYAKTQKEMMGSSLSAEEYYKSIHLSDESYRGKWQEMLITDFLYGIINAL